MSAGDATIYPEVRLGGDRRSASDVFRRRFAVAFERKEVTPAQLRFWREHFMFVSIDALAQLLRVTGRTIRAWEAGKNRIPFAVWWVMSISLSDPDMRIARDCFDLFFVGFRDGQARLMHEGWPDISFTERELLNLAREANRVPSLESELAAARESIARLQSENTELRRLFKTGGLVAELDEMQKRIADLLDRIDTADVIEFPRATRGNAA